MIICFVVSQFGYDGLEAGSLGLASLRYRALIPGRGLARRGHEVWIASVSALTGVLSDGQAAAADELSIMGKRIEQSGAQTGVLQLPRVDRFVISKILEGETLGAVERLVARGSQVLIDVCDDRFDDRNPESCSLRGSIVTAGRAVASTEPMRELILAKTGIDAPVVSDPYEYSSEAAELPVVVPRPLKLLWFGAPMNLEHLMHEMPALHEFGSSMHPLRLVLVTSSLDNPQPLEDLKRQFKTHNQRFRHLFERRLVDWSIQSTWRELAACDIVLIPSDDSDRSRVKSPNRLIESIMAGKLAVAYPLPSYRPLAEYCRLTERPTEGLAWALKNWAALSERIGAGVQYLRTHHSPERIAEQWEQVLAVPFATEKQAIMTTPIHAGASNPVRLNLGCGDKILQGYVNVDVAASRAGLRPDLLCDLHRLEPFADNSVDEILAVHGVEHFWRWEVVEVLREWVRVLKPGSKMILECPNLQSACESFLSNPDLHAAPGSEGQRSMWVFYGDPSWRDPLMVHRWGYTPKSLAAVMAEAGLVKVRQEPAQFKLREPRDMRIVGEKPGPRASASGKPFWKSIA